MKRTSVMVMALCAMLLGAGVAQATPNPKLVCEQSKLAEQAGLESCLKLNRANMLTGTPNTSAQCRAKFNAALKLIDATAAQAGTACRYVDNGDGTVSDLNTGLMWEKKSQADDVHDVANHYTWSNTWTWNGTAPDGTAFTVFLKTLNNGAAPYNDGRPSPITGCFADHCDWRLPSIVELQGIVDVGASGCGSGNPCIDPTFGPTQSDFYWSATDFIDYTFDVWSVDFDIAWVGVGRKLHSYCVRRSGPGYLNSFPRFISGFRVG